MQLQDEILLLENHSQTMRLVIASLTVGRDELEALPGDARRDRLLTLQQRAIDAANEALSFSAAALKHTRAVRKVYLDVSVEASRRSAAVESVA